MSYSDICLLPKGELHVHLNGLIPTEIILKILQEENTVIPEGFILDNDLVRINPCSSLLEYLKPWEVLRLIPTSRKNLKFLIESAFRSLKEQNVKFVEFRNTIVYLAMINGIPTEYAMAWMLEDMDEFSEKYGIAYGLIITIPRGDYSFNHLNSLLKSYNSLGKPSRIIGLDLAGNEETPVHNDLGQQFKAAKEKFGLKVTIHAGETGNLQNVIDAVDSYSADRIGHGTAAASSIEVMDLLREKDICIEACPISNLLTGAIKDSSQHSFINFMKHNVPFVICSDNPGIHQSSINKDYFEFYEQTNNLDFLVQMHEKQKKYSFLNL